MDRYLTFGDLSWWLERYFRRIPVFYFATTDPAFFIFDKKKLNKEGVFFLVVFDVYILGWVQDRLLL